MRKTNTRHRCVQSPPAWTASSFAMKRCETGYALLRNSLIRVRDGYNDLVMLGTG